MPTIKDVAEKAEVSVTTVSRVLNNRGYISRKTRQRVYKVMEELDYQPNELARSLLRKQSNLVGLIIPTVSYPFFAELCNYIEYYSYEYGFKILLCNSHLDRAKEREYIDMLKRNKVNGIIMGSHTLEVDEYINLNLPIVTLDRCIADNIPFISSDNFGGGRLATKYLIKKGCKKIVHVCGNLNLDLLANKRHSAFVSVASAENIEHETIQTGMDVFDIDQYQKIIYDLFAEHPDTDGIFASSDVLAAYVVQVCHQLDRRIPEDVKVIGYDDVKVASMVTPRITTVRQPVEEMSRLAVDLISKQIHGKEITFKNILPVTLIERNTT